ncbi:MAG: polysaccharide deacetylase family protein [Clostridiales bacterium]|nr:polysaccharide deacetylase family protein [Candidatus Blautia equi]
MKKVATIIGAILLVVFVIRGVIMPIVHRVGGGSSETVEKPSEGQLQADGNTEGGEEGAEGTEGSEEPEETEGSESTGTTESKSGLPMASRQPLHGLMDLQKVLQMSAGWHEDLTGKWYRNTDGTYYVSGFQKIDGKTYNFDENGYVRTGWYDDGGSEYFFEEDGVYDRTRRRPMLALTFDDGPGDYTMDLLNCLEENHAKATFFMLGEHVSLYPEEIKKMAAIGCELGNHSFDHPDLMTIGAEGAANQYARTDALLEQVVGQISTVARCPYGSGNSEIFAAVGKPFFMWSLDSLDWSYRDDELDYNAVMNGDLTDGSIILMHDIHEPSVRAAKRIIPDLIERGYRLVTVSELAAAKGVDLKYASYTDFWDSTLANGGAPGYRGQGWDEIEEEEPDDFIENLNASSEGEEDYSEDGDYDDSEDY